MMDTTKNPLTVENQFAQAAAQRLTAEPLRQRNKLHLMVGMELGMYGARRVATPIGQMVQFRDSRGRVAGLHSSECGKLSEHLKSCENA